MVWLPELGLSVPAASLLLPGVMLRMSVFHILPSLRSAGYPPGQFRPFVVLTLGGWCRSLLTGHLKTFEARDPFVGAIDGLPVVMLKLKPLLLLRFVSLLGSSWSFPDGFAVDHKGSRVDQTLGVLSKVVSVL